MAAEDDLRLAWFAHQAGRAGRRDALMSLAAASAGPDDAGWALRVRDRLVTSRPDHPFARFDDLGTALDDAQVLRMLTHLRQTYPPGRVRWLLAQAEAARGPYTGRPPSIHRLLDDLTAPPPIRYHRRKFRQKPTLGVALAPDDPLVLFYLTILLAVAALLHVVLLEAAQGTRAA